jgi:hypothetical protein
MRDTKSMLARIADRSARTEVSLSKGTGLDGTGLVLIYQPVAPVLSISCGEDACSARSWHASVDDAKSMLERIANRSVRIEVSVDQPQRSTPQLWISCDGDSCSARGWRASMDDAKSMLARIADRSVQNEVSRSDGTRLDETGPAGGHPPVAPHLSISCDEDTCNARAWRANLDDAKSMLERIANRSVRIEVTVDQRCQVQRETIPAREPELVAGLEPQVR